MFNRDSTDWYELGTIFKNLVLSLSEQQFLWKVKMIPSKRRRIFSWVIGIFTFVLLHFVFEKFASHFGLSTSFYFEGFERGEYV